MSVRVLLAHQPRTPASHLPALCRCGWGSRTCLPAAKRPCSLLSPPPLCSHLSGHLQILQSSPKEPEFFTETCSYNAVRCPKPAQFRYLRDVSGWVDWAGWERRCCGVCSSPCG